MAKRFSEEEINGIINDYNNGMSLKDLGRKYDRNDAVILSKLKSLNIYKNKTSRWTKEEIILLKEVYNNSNWDYILSLFPRHNKESIIHKASDLKIKKENYFWNDEDIALLKTYYNEEMRLKEIAEKFNYRFSEEAIATKANKLQLKKVYKWTNKEINILKENFSQCTFEELQKLLPKRNIDSIKAKAKKLELQSIYVWKDDEEKYIVENWEWQSDEMMSKYLKRSIRAVKAKRVQLGLFRKDIYVKNYESLTKYFRANNTKWKKDSMKSCDYQCVLTGSKDFQIHHLYGVSAILRDMIEYYNVDLKENFDDYTEDELNELLSLFLKIQSQHPLGECVDKRIHALFHSRFGQQYNTPEQWYIFKQEYLSNQNNYLNP